MSYIKLYVFIEVTLFALVIASNKPEKHVLLRLLSSITKMLLSIIYLKYEPISLKLT